MVERAEAAGGGGRKYNHMVFTMVARFASTAHRTCNASSTPSVLDTVLTLTDDEPPGVQLRILPHERATVVVVSAAQLSALAERLAPGELTGQTAELTGRIAARREAGDGGRGAAQK